MTDKTKTKYKILLYWANTVKKKKINFTLLELKKIKSHFVLVLNYLNNSVTDISNRVEQYQLGMQDIA